MYYYENYDNYNVCAGNEFCLSCPPAFNDSPSYSVIAVVVLVPGDVVFSGVLCLYRTQQGRSVTGPSPQLTIEEPWDSC